MDTFALPTQEHDQGPPIRRKGWLQAVGIVFVDLRVSIGEQEDVGRLQVTVRDAFAVRRGESARDGDRDLHRLANRHRPLREAIRQRLAHEQFGDDEQLVVFDADIVESENAGMRERGDGTRFTLARPSWPASLARQPPPLW